MTSKRFTGEREPEEKKKNQAGANRNWREGVRRHASDVRRNGDEAWEHVPPEMVGEVKRRLGVVDLEPFKDNRELQRLRVVSPKREGLNPTIELERRLRNGTLDENVTGEVTDHERFRARMMSKYAPTK